MGGELLTEVKIPDRLSLDYDFRSSLLEAMFEPLQTAIILGALLECLLTKKVTTHV